MTFDYTGYPLHFVQTEPCNDGSPHLASHIYKFYSPVTKYQYIVRAEFHCGEVFAIKFYCKKDRKSLYKYSKIINKGDLGNILCTCAMLIPLLLSTRPDASFVFAASRSVDVKNKLAEGPFANQRFNLYAYLIPIKFGFHTFEHIAYPAISCYMLYNKKSPTTRKDLEKMFGNTYNDLPSL